ncbi:hypothetical protein HB662_16065 [Roseomonas frigidaquae]|uniref:STAS domain-containing protein n=1 Tax=Falsiroseomonas frigidaquae TaxID=487318 RepID=A0ABX1F1X0_9PROT|nr:hypothetical protein [Falsiroseomonas frigidaquae]NKE46303.1 hypothetical protein [Falsiroseomonas frigidaquae]
MSIRRDGDGILLEGVCPIEDAEAMLRHAQEGAGFVDWSGCTHLHAACLQVLLSSGLALRGTPASPLLAQWLVPMLPVASTQLSEA